MCRSYPTPEVCDSYYARCHGSINALLVGIVWVVEWMLAVKEHPWVSRDVGNISVGQFPFVAQEDKEDLLKNFILGNIQWSNSGLPRLWMTGRSHTKNLPIGPFLSRHSPAHISVNSINFSKLPELCQAYLTPYLLLLLSIMLSVPCCLYIVDW